MKLIIKGGDLDTPHPDPSPATLDDRDATRQGDCPLAGQSIMGAVSGGASEKAMGCDMSRRGGTWHQWITRDLVGIVIAGGGPGGLSEGN